MSTFHKSQKNFKKGRKNIKKVGKYQKCKKTHKDEHILPKNIINVYLECQILIY